MSELPGLRHPSLERLLAAVKGLRGIDGPAALASEMALSDQTVTNWGTRGISKQGALQAQKHFGVSSMWILEGIGPQLVGGEQGQRLEEPALTYLNPRVDRIRPLLRKLAAQLHRLDKPDRQSAVLTFEHLSEFPADTEKYVERLASILGELPAEQTPLKVGSQ